VSKWPSITRSTSRNGAHIEHIGTVNGTLRIAGVETVEDLHTVNGNIEVLEAGGSVHAHTTNGNVHLELAHLREKTAPARNHQWLRCTCAAVERSSRSRGSLLERQLLLGNPHFDGEFSEAREIHGKLGRGRISNPLADHQRRHSSGRLAVNGLASAASKDSGGWERQ